MDALEEAIIEKENEESTGFFPDVDRQWEQFVTYYLPGLEDTAHESERTEHAVCAQNGFSWALNLIIYRGERA